MILPLKWTQVKGMAIPYEEADTIILRQIVSVGTSRILAVAEHTDIFILLRHFVLH